METKEKRLKKRRDYWAKYSKKYWSSRSKVRKRVRNQARKRRILAKLEIFKFLGWKCSNCKIIDWRILQIDHIHGKGKIFRKSTGPNYYEKILKDLKNGSKNYQLLCANCNWIKRWEKGEIKGGLKSVRIFTNLFEKLRKEKYGN